MKVRQVQLSLQVLSVLFLGSCWSAHSLQPPAPQGTTTSKTILSRRSALFMPIAATATAAVATLSTPQTAHAAAGPNGLPLTLSASGLKWADAKVGSGQPPVNGSPVSIDYSMASTAGRFPQIYTTKDKGAPYRWTLGDGTTIAGIEKAVLGDDIDIPPMLPGGIRRVIIPASLGYEAGNKSKACSTTSNASAEDSGIGPVPPKDTDGAFMRW
eukprot:CAMPEP_0195270492 /NCGR_PEP_ID=MMETSP0706-20130129/14389_1 /TAXON_ID=33640 /ORGANISM="Asterionellopsis glacialis, Strain CCMP134" /LENGTH=212 /DNA_ID=CAMNT_0040325787 /DNA_START=58 /DNA_END=693 /DNA_ORIENTATION=+